MREKFKVKLAIIGCASSLIAYSDFLEYDYAQEGLTVQFDAINNVGTGTHDPNASEWVNLKGGSSLILKEGGSGSWANGKALYCNGTGLAASSTESYKYGVTFEYVFKREESTGEKTLIFYGGKSGAYGPYAGWTTGNGFCYTHYSGTSIGVGTFASASCVYAVGGDLTPTGKSTMFLNGLTPAIGGSDNINAGGSSTLIGGTSKNIWPYKGDVYAIRIYSRRLTATETILNACLDRVRFNGEEAETVCASYDGYSYSDGKFRVRTRVFTGGGGNVSVDGGNSLKDTTFQAEYKKTVTLKAVADDGYKFDGWIGPNIIGDTRNIEIQIPADMIASYEAVFSLDGGVAWWQADELIWQNNSWEQILWNSHPSNWLATASKYHRYPANGDKIKFSQANAYNVLFDCGFDISNLELAGGKEGDVNKVTLGKDTTWNISEAITIGSIGSPANVRKLVVDGASVTSVKTTVAGNARVNSELILDNGALVKTETLVVSSSSGSYYGGTGVVTIANGRLELTRNNFVTIALCNGLYTEDSTYAKNSFAKMYIGEKGSARFPFLKMGRNSELVVDGGVIEFQGAAAQRNEANFIMNASSQARQICRIKNGSFIMPVTPTETGYYGNERLSRIEFIGPGEMSFIQEGGVVTNCGIWFKESSGIVPPRYEISGTSEMYMITADHNGDIAAGEEYANGFAANGLAACNTAVNSGTFSIKGGNVKASIPRINTVVSTGGASDNNAGNKTFATTEYRPHIETVITATGASAIELRNSTDVIGMHTVIPEGGMQIVTTNRFAVWRHAEELALTQKDEPYFRVPNTTLWTAGVFNDRPYEWGVVLKDSAKVLSGKSLASGVAECWMDLPKFGTNALREAKVLLNLSSQNGFTLEEVVADMNKAGYDAKIIDEDYNVEVNLMPALSAKSSNRMLVFDFNKVQNAIEVRDGLLLPRALLLGAKAQFETNGFMIFMR